jgi:hypothetical protein
MESLALTAAELAGLAGVTEGEIGRMVDLGVLVAREGPAPFLTIDLRKVRLAMGFAWTSADEPIREDELEVVPVPRLGISTGILDKQWMARVGRAYAEGMRLAVLVERASRARGAPR